MAKQPSHLIGAYGTFWKREEVDWKRGSGPVSWEMLGHRGRSRPGLRVCNFRLTAGFYVLWNDYCATYVGLARGDGGIGAGLRAHNDDGKKDWSRFSWVLLRRRCGGWVGRVDEP